MLLIQSIKVDKLMNIMQKSQVLCSILQHSQHFCTALNSAIMAELSHPVQQSIEYLFILSESSQVYYTLPLRPQFTQAAEGKFVAIYCKYIKTVGCTQCDVKP